MFLNLPQSSRFVELVTNLRFLFLEPQIITYPKSTAKFFCWFLNDRADHQPPTSTRNLARFQTKITGLWYLPLINSLVCSTPKLSPCFHHGTSTTKTTTSSMDTSSATEVSSFHDVRRFQSSRLQRRQPCVQDSFTALRLWLECILYRSKTVQYIHAWTFQRVPTGF